jgi:DNA-binding response OmpR family regulator
VISYGILVVEADILVRFPLARYLRECGFRVLEAVNPHEAEELLRACFKTIDIALIDIDGPDPAGFALARWIRATYPAIEVVLAGTPANAAKKAGDICKEGPALSKPYHHQTVLGQIQRLLANRQRHARSRSLSDGGDPGEEG